MVAVQKVALITAGTAGLGAQVARVLAPDFRVVSKQKRSCCKLLIYNLHR